MTLFKSFLLTITGLLIVVAVLVPACSTSDDDDDDDNTAGTGTLSINSSPQNAYVYLDNAGTGRNTPTSIQNIPIGVHALKLTLDGYQDWQSQVTVIENQTVNVFAQLVPDTDPTPTATPQNPTPTPTPDPSQKPNLHVLSIQVSGGKVTSFKWENNSSVTITSSFLNIVYANIEEPPYYAWPFTVQPPVAPGTYTTSCDITIPAGTHILCFYVDTEDDIAESNETLADNFYCRDYP